MHIRATSDAATLSGLMRSLHLEPITLFALTALLHLQPIFDWNVKELFLYLTAEYSTKSNVSL